MSWYALRVSNRQEGYVLKALGEVRLHGYLPQHVTEARYAKRKATRSKPLIPGYVFALLEDDYDVQAALAIRGVQDASIRVRAIDVGALALEEACHAYDETWVPPKPKGRRYNPRFRSGEHVRIRKGHYAEGLSGLVVKAKGRDRIKVLISIFGRDQEIDVEAKSLEAILDVDARIAA